MNNRRSHRSDTLVPLRRPSLRSVGAAVLMSFVLLAAATVHADDGDPDTSFSGDGKATYAWPTTVFDQEVIDVRTVDVRVLADASIVTLAELDTLGPDRFDACVVNKFRANGAVDTTFGFEGWALANFQAKPEKEGCLGVFAGPGNTIVVAGVIESMALPGSTAALSRLSADGTFDSSFGVGGKVVITAQPFGAAARIRFEDAIQAPDGKILLAGWCEDCGGGSPADFLVLRINANGSVDNTFGTSGWARFARTGTRQEFATAIALDTEGRIVLGGYSTQEDDQTTPQAPMLVRLLANGAKDFSFNETGVVDINLLGSFATGAIAIDPYNDGILLSADITNTTGVVPGSLLMRIRRDGVVDNDFSTSGFVIFQQEEGTHITQLAIRRDRRITAAGWIDPNGTDTRDFFAARVFFNGSLDTSFDGNGSNRYTFTFASNSIDIPKAMILSGERPVLAGTLENEPAETFATGVLRLQSDLIFKSGLEPGQ
jgi:uncharacterized delta-60 repeat protein